MQADGQPNLVSKAASKAAALYPVCRIAVVAGADPAVPEPPRPDPHRPTCHNTQVAGRPLTPAPPRTLALGAAADVHPAHCAGHSAWPAAPAQEAHHPWRPDAWQRAAALGSVRQRQACRGAAQAAGQAWGLWAERQGGCGRVHVRAQGCGCVCWGGVAVHRSTCLCGCVRRPVALAKPGCCQLGTACALLCLHAARPWGVMGTWRQAQPHEAAGANL